MNAEFNWWLLIVGLVGGAGLVWLILGDWSRREEEVGEGERARESAWIAESMREDGAVIDPVTAEEVLRRHRVWLRETGDYDPLDDELGAGSRGHGRPDSRVAADARGPTDARTLAEARGRRGRVANGTERSNAGARPSGGSASRRLTRGQGAATRPVWIATVPSARRCQVTSTSPARRIVAARSRGCGNPSSEVGR